MRRSKVITKIKRENIQVAFWQETYLSNLGHAKLKKMNTFIHLTHLGVRGEWLLSNKLQFQQTAPNRDKEGRYILVKGKIDDNEIILFNVCVPSGHDR